MAQSTSSLSPRVLSIAAILLFVPVMVSIALYPGALWATYSGILYHLAFFLLVPQLDAPEWAKAAGYGWLVLDVMTGVLTINKVPFDIYIYVRLGGHIFAGIWTIAVSWYGSLALKITGVITGAWLILYTFASPFLPLTVLGPNAILVLVWLGIIAWQNGTTATSRLGGTLVRSAPK